MLHSLRLPCCKIPHAPSRSVTAESRQSAKTGCHGIVGVSSVFPHAITAKGLGRVPHVRRGVHGPEETDIFPVLLVNWSMALVGRAKALEGLRPVFFGPCTLRRTWGTRPVTSGLRLVQRLEVKDCGIPHLAKNERDAPNFLHAASDRATCAPFVKERRMRFAGSSKLHRKSGVWGTRQSS